MYVCTYWSPPSSSLQVDGEPFELEPVFAPRQPMSISVGLKSQAVMLSRSRVRTDGVALEALDWAMEAGVLTVEQHQTVLREVARRTGTRQRSKLRTRGHSSHVGFGGGGSGASIGGSGPSNGVSLSSSTTSLGKLLADESSNGH